MVMPLTKNIHICFGAAGKTTNEVFEQWELDAPTRPRFGRNWWFWKPTFRTNGGRFKSHQNTDINFHWLCFHASFTVFSWRCKMQED
jgi:hypothetical protein